MFEERLWFYPDDKTACRFKGDISIHIFFILSMASESQVSQVTSSSTQLRMSQTVEKPTRLTRVPSWVPFAAVRIRINCPIAQLTLPAAHKFTGTSIALAIPLLYLARQRRTVLRKTLPSASPPPLRRTVFPSQKFTLLPLTRPHEKVHFKDSSPSVFASLGTRELLSAIVEADYSIAIFAGKAFAIATGVVAATGAVFVLGVKSSLDVRDVRNFLVVLWPGPWK